MHVIYFVVPSRDSKLWNTSSRSQKASIKQWQLWLIETTRAGMMPATLKLIMFTLARLWCSVGRICEEVKSDKTSKNKILLSPLFWCQCSRLVRYTTYFYGFHHLLRNEAWKFSLEYYLYAHSIYLVCLVSFFYFQLLSLLLSAVTSVSDQCDPPQPHSPLVSSDPAVQCLHWAPRHIHPHLQLGLPFTLSSPPVSRIQGHTTAFRQGLQWDFPLKNAYITMGFNWQIQRFLMCTNILINFLSALLSLNLLIFKYMLVSLAC